MAPKTRRENRLNFPVYVQENPVVINVWVNYLIGLFELKHQCACVIAGSRNGW